MTINSNIPRARPGDSSGFNSSAEFDFTDDELTVFLFTGESKHALLIRKAIEESPDYRARIRELKEKLLFLPSATATRLLDQALDSSAQSVSPIPIGPAEGAGSPAPQIRRIARVVSWCSTIGYAEVTLPVESPDQVDIATSTGAPPHKPRSGQTSGLV